MKKESKKDKVREHLMSGKSLTPLEAWRKYHLYRLSSVIHQLRRKEGRTIITDSIIVNGEGGKPESVTAYRMVKA